jgi:hypothetical protein
MKAGSFSDISILLEGNPEVRLDQSRYKERPQPRLVRRETDEAPIGNVERSFSTEVPLRLETQSVTSRLRHFGEVTSGRIAPRRKVR